MGPESYRIRRNNANHTAIAPFKSLKVTDFCTNQKSICDFLLVNNTNLPAILHRFQVMVDYLSNFSLLTWECLTLMPSLGMIPSEYLDKLYLSRN